MESGHLLPPTPFERLEPSALVDMIAHILDAEILANDRVPLTMDAITRYGILLVFSSLRVLAFFAHFGLQLPLSCPAGHYSTSVLEANRSICRRGKLLFINNAPLFGTRGRAHEAWIARFFVDHSSVANRIRHRRIQGSLR